MATVVFTLALAGVLTAVDQPAPGPPPTIRIVVLPFQNATGEAAWDDWREALPSTTRLCLNTAEFTEVSGGKAIQAARGRVAVDADKPLDAQLAGQIARELEADVVVWGSFARQSNGWLARVMVLRPDNEAAPAHLEVSSSNWVGVTESLARRLTDHLGHRINDNDWKQLKDWFGTSDKAVALVAKALAMEVQKSPAAEREKVLRQALQEDPRCGLAWTELLSLLLEANRSNNELADEVNEFLKQQPDFCPAHLARAWVFFADDGPGAERELREALRVHPGCPAAARGFFLLHGRTNDWGGAARMLESILQVRHNQSTAILLACALAQNQDGDGAWNILKGLSRLPQEDEVEDIALGLASLGAGRFELAGRALTRLGTWVGKSQMVEETLAGLKLYRKEGAASSNAPIARPHAFSRAELNVELERRLSESERASVINPVEITPEIEAEARRVTAGLTNPVTQAIALFAEVARRGRGPGDGGRRTANQALAASQDWQARLSCQEFAKLYVAMARSLGLEAWMVHVERDADGRPCYHDCAALFLEGQGLLVDPTCRAFGIQHVAFLVLDDLQAVSHQAMQLLGGHYDPQRLRAGLKLNPKDRWTRLQFVRGLAAAGQHAAATEELRKVRDAGAESWDVHEAAAELELARERWKPALAELQRADALSPSNALVHFRLAGAYLQLNDPVKSKEHTEAALRFDRGEMPAEDRRESTAQLAMLSAFAQGKSGDRASLDELQRRAERGDLAAQLALAKVCLEDQPPRAEEGMRWLLKAAEQGDDNAQFNYARNLLALRGKDAGEEAVQWLTRSADQGNAEAQYRLGLFLYEGNLVSRDNVAAGQWIFLASKAGNADARQLLREMELFVTTAELAEARKRADAFKPTPTGTGTRNK